METLTWLAIGALAGTAASFAVPRGRGGRLAAIAAGAAAALFGGLAVDGLVGDVALVRVSLVATNSFGVVSFGLAPALAASAAALATLVSLQRLVHAGQHLGPARRPPERIAPRA